MNRIPVSPAAAALLRALVSRAGADRDRILLSDVRSVDWQSLTFAGERHEIELRVTAAGSRQIVDGMCADLGDAEFSIPGAIVADINVVGVSPLAADGSTIVRIEALTICAD
jgi:hypothetical protein